MDTFAAGRTENVDIILSGNSSQILERRRVPKPEPVPPLQVRKFIMNQTLVQHTQVNA